MIDDNEMFYIEPTLRRTRTEKSYTGYAILLAIGVFVLLFHYFVLPGIFAKYGI